MQMKRIIVLIRCERRRSRIRGMWIRRSTRDDSRKNEDAYLSIGDLENQKEVTEDELDKKSRIRRRES